MGSLVETYLRRRDLRNFLRTQELTIATQLSAVDNQIRGILNTGKYLRGELAQSAYLHHYLVGILDAITSFYERETRRRLGLELFRDTFVRYLRERFLLPRHEADAMFSALDGKSQHSGMADGYADGLLSLRGGKAPHQLLDRFLRQAAPAPQLAQGISFALLAAASA